MWVKTSVIVLQFLWNQKPIPKTPFSQIRASSRRPVEMFGRTPQLIAILALLSLSNFAFSQDVVPPAGAAAAAGASSAGAAPATLWRFLGIPQGFQKVRDTLVNRRGNRPRLERKPPMKSLADPANLESPNPAIAAAAEIKQAEDMKMQKIKAIKYLAKIGCGCYDKDGKITDAILAATDDCTPDVREAALKAIDDATSGECCRKCGSTSCCNEKITKRLSELAYERDDSGCPIEPNADIRKLAAKVLKRCCPGGPPSGPIEEDAGPELIPALEGVKEIPGETPEIEGESSGDEIEGESADDESEDADVNEDAEADEDVDGSENMELDDSDLIDQPPALSAEEAEASLLPVHVEPFTLDDQSFEQPIRNQPAINNVIRYHLEDAAKAILQDRRPKPDLVNIEPTPLAAVVRRNVDPAVRPEASVYGSQEMTFSSAQPKPATPAANHVPTPAVIYFPKRPVTKSPQSNSVRPANVAFDLSPSRKIMQPVAASVTSPTNSVTAAAPSRDKIVGQVVSVNLETGQVGIQGTDLSQLSPGSSGDLYHSSSIGDRKITRLDVIKSEDTTARVRVTDPKTLKQIRLGDQAVFP